MLAAIQLNPTIAKNPFPRNCIKGHMGKKLILVIAVAIRSPNKSNDPYL
jgi:hypothetical protein